ncbi:manganese efflux pump [Synechococcus sp. BDU 130192]|uniref:manganese efflux pump n=2 Tax=Synechococcus sp. BDU 130192 TaxID=2042059 RepID=UPI000C08B990
MAITTAFMGFESDIIIFALVLSIDSFSAALALGIRHFSGKRALFFALSSGLSEGVAIALGFILGRFAQTIIMAYDHWVAFALLVLVGGHMCYNAYQEMRTKPGDDDGESVKIHSLWKILFISSITSIDSLGVGVSLGLIGKPLVPYSLSIGLAAFCATYGGLFCAKLISGHLGEKVEFFGGGVLIALGLKMLSI